MRAVLYFIALFFLAGIGPTVYFKKIFKLNNIFSFSLFSLSLGSVFFNLTVITLGHMSLPVMGTSLKLYSLSIVTISVIISILCYVKENTLLGLKQLPSDIIAFIKSSNSSLTFTNISALLPLLLYFFYISFVNTRLFFPSWDHFTYWLIDAKNIFESGYLRSDSRVSNIFTNSSYYPLHAAYLFDWWGFTVEQTASFFSIFYALLSSLLAFQTATHLKKYQLFLVSAIILSVNATIAGFLLTFYADIINSFFFTLFFVILLKDAPQSEYFKKIVLILTVLFGLSLIKSPNIYYVAFLAAFALVYDHKQIYSSIKKITFKSSYFFCLTFIVAAIASRIYYLKYVFTSDGYPHPLIDVARISYVVYDRLIYIDQTINLIFSEYTVLSALVVAALVKFTETTNRNKRSSLLLAALFLFPAINLGDYFISMYGHQSKSILRYISTVFFLIPLYFSFLGEKQASRKMLTYSCGVLLYLTSAVYFFIAYIEFPAFTANAHTGQYKEFSFHKETHALSERITKTVGNSPLLIASDDGDIYVGNMQLGELLYRYYLSKNTIGGMYRIDKKVFRDKIAETKPKFILVTNFNNKLREIFKYKGTETPVLFKVLTIKPLRTIQVSY